MKPRLPALLLHAAHPMMIFLRVMRVMGVRERREAPRQGGRRQMGEGGRGGGREERGRRGRKRRKERGEKEEKRKGRKGEEEKGRKGEEKRRYYGFSIFSQNSEKEGVFFLFFKKRGCEASEGGANPHSRRRRLKKNIIDKKKHLR